MPDWRLRKSHSALSDADPAPLIDAVKELSNAGQPITSVRLTLERLE
jgi:hypothetical protein